MQKRNRHKYQSNPIDAITVFVLLFAFVWLACAVIPQIFSYHPAINKVEAKEERPPTSHYIPMKLEIAAYAPLDNKSGICADDTPLLSATGELPKRGMAAVNFKQFPAGTKFYIPGYGYAIAEDTGGYVRKHKDKIEVVFDTYEECIKWGRKNLIVYVEIMQ